MHAYYSHHFHKATGRYDLRWVGDSLRSQSVFLRSHGGVINEKNKKLLYLGLSVLATINRTKRMRELFIVLSLSISVNFCMYYCILDFT